jgi:hypothetical protein
MEHIQFNIFIHKLENNQFIFPSLPITLQYMQTTAFSVHFAPLHYFSF